MSPSKRDKMITSLGEEIYKGFMVWECRENDILIPKWRELSSDEKLPFKKIAQILYKLREKEGKIVK